MRIVIDGRMILPEMSGVGRYVIGLCKGLAEQEDDYSYELWVQASLPAHHPVYELGGERLEIRRLPFRHMSLGGQVHVPIELARSNADLLHYPHFDLPWMAPGRVVATIHDLKYILRPDFFPRNGSLKRLALSMMMSHTCRRSQLVICDSRSTATDLERHLGIPEKKLRVAALGVDDRFLEPLPRSSLRNYKEREGLERPFVLYVGERRPHKNLPGLLEAFKLFRSQAERDFQLVIAGKRYADYDIPEKRTAELGLEQHVRFLDYVPDGDLPFLYQSAEAVILISYYEGFGLPVLEAMASGTPVVASNCTSLPEVTGAAGLLVPPDDPNSVAEALFQVVAPGETRDRCIANGFEQASQFSWERCARQTRTIYQEALAS